MNFGLDTLSGHSSATAKVQVGMLLGDHKAGTDTGRAVLHVLFQAILSLTTTTQVVEEDLERAIVVANLLLVRINGNLQSFKSSGQGEGRVMKMEDRRCKLVKYIHSNSATLSCKCLMYFKATIIVVTWLCLSLLKERGMALRRFTIESEITFRLSLSFSRFASEVGYEGSPSPDLQRKLNQATPLFPRVSRQHDSHEHIPLRSMVRLPGHLLRWLRGVRRWVRRSSLRTWTLMLTRVLRLRIILRSTRQVSRASVHWWALGWRTRISRILDPGIALHWVWGWGWGVVLVMWYLSGLTLALSRVSRLSARPLVTLHLATTVHKVPFG